jgi:hypothetical protein
VLDVIEHTHTFREALMRVVAHSSAMPRRRAVAVPL